MTLPASSNTALRRWQKEDSVYSRPVEGIRQGGWHVVI